MKRSLPPLFFLLAWFALFLLLALPVPAFAQSEVSKEIEEEAKRLMKTVYDYGY